MEIGFKHIDDYYDRHTPEYGTHQLEFDPLHFIDEAYTTYNGIDAKLFTPVEACAAARSLKHS